MFNIIQLFNTFSFLFYFNYVYASLKARNGGGGRRQRVFIRSRNCSKPTLTDVQTK